MYTYSFRGNLITQVFSTQTQLLNVSTGKSPIAFNILLCNNVSELPEHLACIGVGLRLCRRSVQPFLQSKW